VVSDSDEEINSGCKYMGLVYIHAVTDNISFNSCYMEGYFHVSSSQSPWPVYLGDGMATGKIRSLLLKHALSLSNSLLRSDLGKI